MNNTPDIITGGIQVPKAPADTQGGQVGNSTPTNVAQPQQTNRSAPSVAQPSQAKIERSVDTVGPAPEAVPVAQEKEQEQEPVQQPEQKPAPKSAEQTPSTPTITNKKIPQTKTTLPGAPKITPFVMPGSLVPGLLQTPNTQSKPLQEKQHFSKRELLQLLSEQSAGGGGTKSGIKEPDAPNSSSPFTSNPEITKKAVRGFAEKTKDLFKSGLVNLGPYVATPPSAIAASAFGRIGHLGFDATNQAEYAKHIKSLIDVGTLKGLTDKIPLAGKYLEAGREELADLGVAMYLDPRALGRRTRYTRTQPSQSKATQPASTETSEKSPETPPTPSEKIPGKTPKKSGVAVT